jgi:hypothetical protein
MLIMADLPSRIVAFFVGVLLAAAWGKVASGRWRERWRGPSEPALI